MLSEDEFAARIRDYLDWIWKHMYGVEYPISDNLEQVKVNADEWGAIAPRKRPLSLFGDARLYSTVRFESGLRIELQEAWYLGEDEDERTVHTIKCDISKSARIKGYVNLSGVYQAELLYADSAVPTGDWESRVRSQMNENLRGVFG